jgi:hypothetical protein
VHWLKTTAAVVMLVLWSLASNHCKLEALPGLTFLECSPASATESHCDDSGCASVEAGGCKVEDQQSVLHPMLASVILAEMIRPLAASRMETSATMLLTVAPPELPHCWQFVFRTAASPRAPSLAS